MESDIEEDEEEDTRSICKGRGRPAKTVTVQLPPSPNFEYFVYLKLLYQAFINLPSNYEANFSKPINLFFFFFQTPY